MCAQRGTPAAGDLVHEMLLPLRPTTSTTSSCRYSTSYMIIFSSRYSTSYMLIFSSGRFSVRELDRRSSSTALIDLDGDRAKC